MSIPLFETEHWEVILFENQINFGYCVVSIKRECSHLSDVTSHELLDFHENVLRKLESVFSTHFNAEPFNWMCMMNHAYKRNPPNPHVHWHFRPRYSKPVVFDGVEYADEKFAHHYDKNLTRIVDEKTLEKIRDHLLMLF